MKVAFTGASGFVGSALRAQFPDHVILGRHDDESSLASKLHNVDVVINLAGAPIIKRWNDAYKKVLYSSRIETTERLVTAINQSNVGYFISTSAIGYYPDNATCDESCSENSADFLSGLTRAWEAKALACEKPTAILRFGIILGKNGGALKQMLTPFRLGVGGNIGNGKMMMSWIAIDDLVSIYSFLIEKQLSGAFNAVAPTPVSNAHFTKTLGKTLYRPTLFPLPVIALKMIYGDASSVLTGSKEIYPKALSDAGFSFNYPTIEEALPHLLKG